jgi:predicted nucleic acid-binding Zn ribbon protein
MKDPMDTLSRILRRILETNRELKSGVHEARILELWPKAVGEGIARHARAVQIKAGTLYVAVEQSVWRQELLANKQRILEKLNTTLRSELGDSKGESEAPWIRDLFFLSGGTSGNRTKAGKAFRKK